MSEKLPYFLAKLFYLGYQYDNRAVERYVHGNIDAVTLSAYKITLIGNLGTIKSFYIAQHDLIGQLKYEFVCTNPTDKNTTKTFLNTNNWEKVLNIVIHSLGSKTNSVTLNLNAMATQKFKIKVYLCRLVVFRIKEQRMDVFNRLKICWGKLTLDFMHIPAGGRYSSHINI